MTFTPKIYGNENPLFLNEYRQAFKNGFLILDTSYTEGYKNTSLNNHYKCNKHIELTNKYKFNIVLEQLKNVNQ